MKTQEEKKEWRRKMMELNRQISSMSEEQKLSFIKERGGIVNAIGETLSWHNTIMLHLLNPHRQIVQVGGYRQWKLVGRQVKKGEKSCGSILFPMLPKEKDTDDTVTEIRFGSCPVWDISQTEEVAETEKVNA